MVNKRVDSIIRGKFRMSLSGPLLLRLCGDFCGAIHGRHSSIVGFKSESAGGPDKLRAVRYYRVKEAAGIAGFDAIASGDLPHGGTSLVVGGAKADRTIRTRQFLVILLSGILGLLPIGDAHARASLKVGVVRYIGEATTFVADEKGYFRDQDLDVQLVINSSGNQSFAQLMRGEVDLAMVAPLPLVFAAIERNNPAGKSMPPFVIIANLMQSSAINLVLGRTDRGIHQPRDLEGKRVALSVGTASEYFWYAFALHHGIDATKVRIIDVGMGDMRKTFEAGTVDAVVAWEPNVEDIRSNTSAPTLLMSGTQIYSTDWIMVARREYAERNADTLARYLRALIAAERLLRTEPATAARMHAGKIGMPEAGVRRLFGNIVFNVSLGEAMLVNLELQGRWAVDHKLAGKGIVPNFREIIFEAPLRSVRRESVSVIR